MSVLRRIRNNARACTGVLATATSAAVAIGIVAQPSPASGGDGADVPLSELSDAQLKREAASRFSERGVAVDTADLVVERVPDGEVLIRPRDLDVRLDPDGTTSVDLSIQPPDHTGTSEGEASALAPVLVHGTWDCLARLRDTSAWMDACFRTTVMNGEPDDGHWYASADVFGTASGLGLDFAAVGFRETSGFAEWRDWQPRGSYTGNCATNGLGIELGRDPFVLTYQLPFYRCETQRITKYNPEVRFDSEWRGGGTPFFNEQREAALMVSWAMPDTKPSEVSIGAGVHDVYD